MASRNVMKRWLLQIHRHQCHNTFIRSVASISHGNHESNYHNMHTMLLATSGLALVAASCSLDRSKASLERKATDDSTNLLNWSGTHAVSVHNRNYFEPSSIDELQLMVKHCHSHNQPMRPLGSALSPNGIAFSSLGMVSMADMDQLLELNMQDMTVTVQAGCRVSQVIEELRKYNLTLPNLASIAEQQMGGFISVGAHGTGAAVAPVDDYVTRLTIVTPALGTLTLSEKDGEWFHLAKVGLGCLGVVAEVTMKVIPAHNLVEHTFCLTRAQAKDQLPLLLKQHKHMRYMWIPHTDVVVCVTNDPEGTDVVKEAPRAYMEHDDETRFAPLRELLLSFTKDHPTDPATPESIKGMGFGELRDALLAVDPLDVDHVKLINAAEAEFWKRSEGYQTKPSDQLLQFDCGGQQWVWEICFPTGTYDEKNNNDITFMEKLLAGIEDMDIPAHSPIEQRWSSSSSSLMSPAHGPPDGLHSWVGIIMYLPSEDERQRREITEKFNGMYCDLMRSVGHEVNAASHWAKLEMPKTIDGIVDLQEHMKERYPVQKFNDLRATLDPKNIMGNSLMDLAFRYRTSIGRP
jgi:L-galactono-1,4-lactone dehydrogenase